MLTSLQTNEPDIWSHKSMDKKFVTPELNHLETFVWYPKVDLFDNNATIEALTHLVKELGLTVIDTQKHTFTPQGLSIIFLLAESHMGVHTWPELGFFHIDFLTCGKPLSKDKVTQAITALFQPDKLEIKDIDK